LWAFGLKIFIFYIFFEQGNVEKHDGKDIGGTLERPKKLLLRQSKALKKNIMGAKNIFKF